MLQAILGGLAGAAVVLKLFGRKIMRRLTFWKKAPSASTTTDAAAADSRVESASG